MTTVKCIRFADWGPLLPQHLVLLCEVAEGPSLVAAGCRLGLTQPETHGLLNSAEHAVGELLERDQAGRRMCRLTPLGEALVEALTPDVVDMRHDMAVVGRRVEAAIEAQAKGVEA